MGFFLLGSSHLSPSTLIPGSVPRGSFHSGYHLAIFTLSQVFLKRDSASKERSWARDTPFTSKVKKIKNNGQKRIMLDNRIGISAHLGPLIFTSYMRTYVFSFQNTILGYLAFTVQSSFLALRLLLLRCTLFSIIVSSSYCCQAFLPLLLICSRQCIVHAYIRRPSIVSSLQQQSMVSSRDFTLSPPSLTPSSDTLLLPSHHLRATLW